MRRAISRSSERVEGLRPPKAFSVSDRGSKKRTQAREIQAAHKSERLKLVFLDDNARFQNSSDFDQSVGDRSA